MRRKGLLAVTGCGESRFNSLSARDELPFPSEGKWREYTLEDAFRLHFMLQLVDTSGASLDLARYIVGNAISPRHVSMHPLNYSPSWGGDIWACGVVMRDDSALNDEGQPFWRAHWAGRLVDMPQAVSKWNGAATLICGNASASAVWVREQARQYGFPEGDDFSQVWACATMPSWVEGLE